MKYALPTVAAVLLLAASHASAQDQAFVDIRQLGMGNQATASQTNTTVTTSWITQTGDGFSAATMQTGSGNRAGIQQH